MTVRSDLAAAFSDRLQIAYAGMLQSCGIESRDIVLSPDQRFAINQAEAALSHVVADWILSTVDPDALAAVPDDRHGVTRVRAAMLATPAGDGG